MRWFFAFAIALFLQNSMCAAVVEVKPKASAVLNMDFTPLAMQPALDGPIVQLPARDEPYLIQVDVSMRIYDLQPGQVGFSNTAFNVEVANDGSAYSDLTLQVPAWNADLPVQTDCECPYHPGWWEINSDDGPNRNDLLGIILAGVTSHFGPPATDLRRTLGQGPNGQYAGTVYVELPGSQGASTYLETFTPWGASTYNATGISTTAGNRAVGLRTSTFVVVPEPGAIALLFLGLPLLALKLRK